MKTQRIGSGQYVVILGSYTVTVTHFENFNGWIASATWDRHLHTDPLSTKREAVRNAEAMIREAITQQININAKYLASLPI